MIKSRCTIVMLLCIFTALFLANCSGDNPLSSEGSLVGTWKLTKMTMESSLGTFVFTGEQLNLSITVTIKSDHTYQATIIDDEGTENETGTWSVSGKKVTMTDSNGESQTMDFTVSGNKLTITFTEIDQSIQVTVTQEFVRQ